MYCVKQITDDMYWVGGNDRRLALFENIYPISRGVSYNSYLVMDEQTILFDTVDKSVSGIFFENVEHVLAGRKLNYLVVNHMEPDHCGTMEELVLRYPDVKIVCNPKTIEMIRNFFSFDIDSRAVIVNEMDTLCTGRHTYAFVMAPMVHWPEAMVSYDVNEKILYSADAFGTFGAINGNYFADEVNFETEYLEEARRYYTNIVGKYGDQVQALLGKASTIEIEMVCPLHGPVWRKNIGWFIEKYQRWSTYTPEEDAVMLVYGSIYGNTENVANIIATKLGDAGVRNVKVYDASATHPSVIVSEAFRVSHIVFLSATYNAGIFSPMETVIHDIVAHNLQNRKVAIVENGSWAPAAGGLMRGLLSGLKDITFLNDTLTVNSSLKKDKLAEVDAIVTAIVNSLPKKDEIVHTNEAIEPNAMFKLSYGLFLLTARDGAKDNGCIINTVTQITDTPKRISIAVNKANLTHDMIMNSGMFNVSVLTNDTPFDMFKYYGFQSGRNVDKFAGVNIPRSENGLPYLAAFSNAFISAKVVASYDYGTHTVFVADVTEAKVLSNEPSLTYAYYFANIKPKPALPSKEKKGYVCKICGYVYEGEVLPDDYVCPLCKHGPADFEKIS